MKKVIVVLMAVGLLVLSFGTKSFCNELAWQDISRGNLNLKTVLVNPGSARIIYIGSNNGVFKTEDGGETWRNALSVKGQNKAVNFLLFDPKDKYSIYAATGNGLFHSSNQGREWKRIFKGKSYFENDCTTLAVLPSFIYLGTRQGLFVSRDKGRSWHKQSGKLGNSHILSIACNLKESNCIYVACVDGVFKTKDGGKSWERIFVVSATENAENHDEPQETSEDQDEQERFSAIRYITLDPNNQNHLYLACSKGVYISQDKAVSWKLLSDYGLLSRDVRFLLISLKSNLYAITKSGIFAYKNERWQELSFGLMAEDIRSIALDNQNNLYAASDKGLFKAKPDYFSYDTPSDIKTLYSKNELGINEVQQAAIEYAEVKPEKIREWRRQAKARALLPKLTVGVDTDKNQTVSKSIWGTYSSYSSGNVSAPGRYYIGPDDDTIYKNKNWSVSLTWELGDLIWSDDQTNIDVRSRLMVQLRDDILDEVTKLYFERLRVKMELDNISILESKKRTEKELRLQELTAMLDALTGGYFSQQLKSKLGP